MTPTSADGPLLLDTSAAVALVVSDHEAHERTFAALSGQPLGLAGHACFELFSVLTRLPTPARLTPTAARRLIDAGFPHSRHLSADRAASLLADLPAARISGGAVYDALVAAAAVEHGLELASRDRRALTTYQRLGAVVRLLD